VIAIILYCKLESQGIGSGLARLLRFAFIWFRGQVLYGLWRATAHGMEQFSLA